MIRIIEENKSITLKTSPLIIKSPFIKRRKAQNKVNGINGGIPNISIKNAKAAARSIAPRIFTNTM